MRQEVRDQRGGERTPVIPDAIDGTGGLLSLAEVQMEPMMSQHWKQDFAGADTKDSVRRRLIREQSEIRRPLSPWQFPKLKDRGSICDDV